MIDFLKRINAWANEKPWHTWVTHSVVAIALVGCATTTALLFWLVGWLTPFTAAANGVVWYFVWREGEQYAHRSMAGQPTDWLDVAMDVIGPALTIGLLAWLL